MRVSLGNVAVSFGWPAGRLVVGRTGKFRRQRVSKDVNVNLDLQGHT